MDVKLEASLEKHIRQGLACTWCLSGTWSKPTGFHIPFKGHRVLLNWPLRSSGLWSSAACGWQCVQLGPCSEHQPFLELSFTSKVFTSQVCTISSGKPKGEQEECTVSCSQHFENTKKEIMIFFFTSLIHLENSLSQKHSCLEFLSGPFLCWRQEIAIGSLPLR